jgi:hypothetical protein
MIGRLNGRRQASGNPRGRKPRYDARLIEHVTILWGSMERICEKRMKAALPIWLPFYKHPGFTHDLRGPLLTMSPSTLGRFLKLGMKRVKGLSTTKRAKFFKYKIPLHVFGSKIVNVGHVAADTVAHCGDRIDGTYANSLTVTDRLTGWTANRAMNGKKAFVMMKALQSIEADLPFRLISLQSDCGTEFLNYTFVRYLDCRPKPIAMSRSRPYHKNDNAHVERTSSNRPVLRKSHCLS